MTFACEDVSVEGGDVDADADESESERWAAFDVVFLAALVGLDARAKAAILRALAKKLRAGALIVARSAQGLRAVLYPVSVFTGVVFVLFVCLMLPPILAAVGCAGARSKVPLLMRYRSSMSPGIWRSWASRCWWKCTRGPRSSTRWSC